MGCIKSDQKSVVSSVASIPRLSSLLRLAAFACLFNLRRLGKKGVLSDNHGVTQGSGFLLKHESHSLYIFMQSCVLAT